MRRWACFLLVLSLGPRAQAAPPVAADPARVVQGFWPGLSFSARSAELSPAQAARVTALSGEACQAGRFDWLEAAGGQAVVFSSALGKHLPMDFALAVDPQGRVHGLELLAYREAYGGQVRQAPWREKFKGRALDDSLRVGQGIDAISGATISVRHLTGAVRRVLATLKVLRAPAPAGKP